MFKMLDFIVAIVLVFAGLNWGFVGLFGMNFVTMLFGGTMMTTGMYALMGAAAIYRIFGFFGCCGCKHG